ncbi:LOW QUALITY PROTEIN: membrane progestin receptor beta-like [Hippoglossus hippoglossus]|uniref:LOW QUALITY PROTEIN: membrane progestin receptor beta-like n=1 Tax=Hippoglossus hippoglossus TaxID=8267 RepID=UPI00148BA26E|nr:LOW QUALITY PROTEIN: membrane progestin receptor beta-like [Hippoglossus hippoglossus]
MWTEQQTEKGAELRIISHHASGVVRPSLSVPHLSPSAGAPLPSLPPTVRDVDVPPLFREQFILSGYRPVDLSWRCYVLSLFQIHNETLSVWSHLLAAVYVLVRFLMFTGPEGQGFSVDVSSLPLVLYVFSAVTYLKLLVAALQFTLLHSRADAPLALFFLEHVGVAVYQYGCALALCLYSSDTGWTQSMLGQIFLPVVAVVVWLSCIICCYTDLHFHRPYLWHRRICQVVPMGVAYLLVISPVTHRLASHNWTNTSTLPLHFLQVALFLLSAVFFSCPVPECFSPGRYDIIGHSRQLFHILLSICTLVQQEALFEDFLWRRQALVREFGEERLLLACASFLGLTLCCVMTALVIKRRTHVQLLQEGR